MRKPAGVPWTEDLFWSFVDIREEGCWHWLGACSVKKTPRGPVRRGVVRGWREVEPRGGTRASHVAWELVHGEPPSLLVCHTCDNPICVRPTHLFLGTNQDNLVDCVLKGRLTIQNLTADQVLEIRRRLAGGERRSVLALEYGVSDPAIGDIKYRRTWRHLEEDSGKTGE